VLREHQQQAVVDLDGPVDLLDEFLAPLHVFRSELTRIAHKAFAFAARRRAMPVGLRSVVCDGSKRCEPTSKRWFCGFLSVLGAHSQHESRERGGRGREAAI
jgi:hypothetical protein